MKEFKKKILGKIGHCCGLQIKHKFNEIFIHQFAYVEKILKCFNMDKGHPLSIPMIVRSLDPKQIYSALRMMTKRYLV